MGALSSIKFSAQQARAKGRTANPFRMYNGRWPGVELRVTRESISPHVEWAVHEDRHVVIIHLDGPIYELETELDGCAVLRDPPMAGEIWVIPAGQHYRSRARGGVIQYAELVFEEVLLAEMFGKAAEAPRIRPRAGHYDPFLHRSVARLTQLAGPSDDIARMQAHAVSQALFLHFFNAFRAHVSPSALRRPKLSLHTGQAKQLAEYVDDHLSEPITLDMLSSLVCRKPHELLIAFRRSLGTTPAQFVIERRLRRARWLLTHTGKSIATVAFETGFSNHSHLSATFKARVGVTPHYFRDQAGDRRAE